MVLAYEPVWAIGTGKTATPEQVTLILPTLFQPDVFHKNVAIVTHLCNANSALSALLQRFGGGGH